MRGPSYFIMWSYHRDELLSHARSMKLVFKLTWHYHVRQIAISTNIMLVPWSFRFKLSMTYILMESDSLKYHACSMELGFKLSMTFIIRWDDKLKTWYAFHESLASNFPWQHNHEMWYAQISCLQPHAWQQTKLHHITNHES